MQPSHGVRLDHTLQARLLHPVAAVALGSKGPFLRVPVPGSSVGHLPPAALWGAHTSPLRMRPTPHPTVPSSLFNLSFLYSLQRDCLQLLSSWLPTAVCSLSLVQLSSLLNHFLFPSPFHFLSSMTHQRSVAELALLELTVCHHVRRRLCVCCRKGL